MLHQSLKDLQKENKGLCLHVECSTEREGYPVDKLKAIAGENEISNLHTNHGDEISSLKVKHSTIMGNLKNEMWQQLMGKMEEMKNGHLRKWLLKLRRPSERPRRDPLLAWKEF
ncbi:hypothetical protein V6N13_001892 [Hibiscus sabdariffa]|uniref:Uncharacterized protein n=2 Tax=Hibiscus sabdariffa TaxID=183260 RepID=A0ABR1Z873_9ROSI